MFWIWMTVTAIAIVVSMRLAYKAAPSKVWPWMLLGAVYMFHAFAAPWVLGSRYDVSVAMENTGLVVLTLVTGGALAWDAADYVGNKSGPSEADGDD